LRRPAHCLAAVLLVALALVVALLARSMGTPRATAAEKLTMEVCLSSGVYRLPMDPHHGPGHHDHENCCSGAWLGLPASVPVNAATPVPRHAAPAIALQSVAKATSTQ
jgi:hypothetical protein